MISMASPLGSILASIFVGFSDKPISEHFFKPYCYTRYVDDIFVSFKSQNKAMKFFQLLNNLHPSLKFMTVGEKNMILSFLDVLIESSTNFSLLTYIGNPLLEVYI